MKKYNYIKSLALLISTTMITGSCSEEILNYPDPNARNTDTYFNTPAEIEQGAFAIYSSFHHNSMFGWQLPEVFDVMANESDGRPSSAGEANIHLCWRYQHNNQTDVFWKYWRLLYRMIMRSNLVIYKGGEYVVKNGNDEKVSFALGDAYFLRGWAYSQLAFHWGSVPLRTSFTPEEGDNARVPAQQVWDQVEADFKQAQNLLPESWPANFEGRATKGAATGFLGKLYLYNKKYALADAEFAKMDGKFKLLPKNKWDYNHGETNEYNEENVFSIIFYDAPGTNQWVMFEDPEDMDNAGRQNARAQLYSWTDWSNWGFQPRRVADFQYNDETGIPFVDPRAALTFYGGTIGDQTYGDNTQGGPQPFPFAEKGYWYRKGTNKENKLSEGGVRSGNNIRLMRYADVLLMRAECKLETGDIPACISFINQVRKRIAAFEYMGSYDKAQAFELLKRERQLELMGEMHRYNDLKRWGILKETINVETQALWGTQNVQDKHNLFPVPQQELDTNPEFGSVANSWN
ncbi:MAG: RagB/SusD domain-containing [Prolixibacteraceae bacterium]|nr:MAG: RagB/SusD domain-containing [Prolixibacteraceae bacterium]